MKPESFFGLLLDTEEAVAWREEQRAAGRRIVFTNGCFDLIHSGHIEYLAWARSQGDALIVGLNDDASVAKIKGAQRPLVAFGQRARVLCALRSVDVVVGFGESTPVMLIDRIRPDLHVKGAQYKEEELPERAVVMQHGGAIRLAPHVAGSSTTQMIARILARYG